LHEAYPWGAICPANGSDSSADNSNILNLIAVKYLLIVCLLNPQKITKLSV